MANRYIGDPRLVNNLNNLFLNMIDLMEPLEPEPVPCQAAAAAVSDEGASGRVKLPEFWPHAPGIWFARAELHFEVSQVTGERQKFAYTVDALPYESLCLVADLLESPPASFSYTILKECLMMLHQLSPVQKAMKLMDLPDLGDRRQSQLLADLLQYCPPGEQGTAFFRSAFLKRLPAHIQVHLSQVESVDLKELAQRADQLYLTRWRPVAAMPMAAVAPEDLAVEDSMLAAMSGKQKAAGAAGQQAKRKPR
jgi:hypothetical protein